MFENRKQTSEILSINEHLILHRMYNSVFFIYHFRSYNRFMPFKPEFTRGLNLTENGAKYKYNLDRLITDLRGSDQLSLIFSQRRW